MSRTRVQWRIEPPPKCFTTDEWQEWWAARAGAYSPCQDCTPQYRQQMRDALRCERPEVIFVLHPATGETEGIVAEDPRYARLLMGLSISRAAITGRAIEMTETWAALLRHVQGRAHAETKHAIDVWLKRWKRANGDKG